MRDRADGVRARGRQNSRSQARLRVQDSTRPCPLLRPSPWRLPLGHEAGDPRGGPGLPRGLRPVLPRLRQEFHRRPRRLVVHLHPSNSIVATTALSGRQVKCTLWQGIRRACVGARVPLGGVSEPSARCCRDDRALERRDERRPWRAVPRFAWTLGTKEAACRSCSRTAARSPVSGADRHNGQYCLTRTAGSRLPCAAGWPTPACRWIAARQVHPAVSITQTSGAEPTRRRSPRHRSRLAGPAAPGPPPRR